MTGNGEIRTALFMCGKCRHRWRAELNGQPIGCPVCRNYSVVGYSPKSIEIIKKDAKIKEE